MPRFAYRAIAPGGRPANGQVDATSRVAAVAEIRRLGFAPVDVRELAPLASNDNPARRTVPGKARRAASKTIGELAVLLNAGLPLDRALALALDNIEDPAVRSDFADVLKRVKEGEPLSRAMARNPAMFPAIAQAMAEAGEANGKLGAALNRLAGVQAQAEEVRTIVISAMIYPIILMVIAVAIVLMMLLFVVPQFDSLFAQSADKLPPESIAVLAASRGLRAYGLYWLAGIVGLGFVARGWLSKASTRAWADRAVLRLPQLGTLVRHIETARFARTLGALVEGGVAVPAALAVAHRTIANHSMAAAIGAVTSIVKEGGGLTRPLAESGALPRLAIGFLRTGEEISQLGPMLGRLADVLDGDVKVRLQRLVAIMTPFITVALGGAVALIIAAIMSAILGFNDVAVS
ncbi:MAG: type II secretion system F family protein [Sphingomonas sp.]